MRITLLVGLLALTSCIKRDNTVQCNHENDKAAWAQSGMTAAQYDSQAVAQNKRCTAP